MLTFYDSQNQPYRLGEQLGRGGEGAVFSCEDLSIVAKIYHEPVEEEKAEKLRWMAENKDEHLLKVAAWVIDVLTDAPDGKVVGFLMPNVRAKEIHELYSLKSRRIYFPEATWHFLVHTSANVARAFYSLHKHTHVMGDVNHGNCVVLADGTVKLIDCDSYSIKTDKLRYRCDVGVATHLAPELHGIDLGEIEREPNHDNFGLAVIIFQLLFLGRHPFAGNYTGAEDKSLEECIREHRFAYGETAELRQVKQPPGTLSLSQVSPRIAKLFERAFSSKNVNRPTPREWIEALEDLSNNLEKCSFHPGHHYFNALANCPWCAIESQTGVMLFPFFGSSKDKQGERQFNVFTIESLISNLGIPSNLPARPPKPEILPAPSPEIISSQKTNRNRQYAIIGTHFVLLTMLMAIFGVGVSCFLGFLLMAIFIAVLNESDKTLRNEINDRLTAARQKWEQLENEWSQYVSPKKITDELSRIKFKINQYQNLQTASVRQLKSLDEAKRKQTFENYIKTVEIDDAKNLGVDEVHINALKYHGIKTADDLTEEKLDTVLPVHKNIKSNLLDWRKNLETSFHFSNKSKISSEERDEFLQETALKRRTIERDIESLFASLRSGSIALRQRQHKIVGESETTAQELSQAESDLGVVGTNSFAVLALLLITFVMPFIGIFISEVNSLPPKPPVPRKPPAYSGDRGSDFTPPEKPGRGDSAIYNLPVPSETITNREILEMSKYTRDYYADNLLQQAVQLRTADRNFTDAKLKLFLALRLKPGDVILLNEVGSIFYEERNYLDSLEYFKRSLKVDKDNFATKIYIGMNHLQMKDYAAARDILKQVTNGDSNSFEGFYNLGLAYEGLENYSSATVAFRKALKINPDDADSHYKLGYCFYKLGNLQAAHEQYLILLDKNKELARRFYDETDLNKFYGGEGEGTGRGEGSGFGN